MPCRFVVGRFLRCFDGIFWFKPFGMRPKIVVVGSSNTDMVLRLARIPAPGETVLGGAFAVVQGGKGANQAVAAARLGGDVALVGRVGDDDFGRAARLTLEADGIDTAHLISDTSQATGVALICVSAEGENAIGVASGANAAVTVADVHLAEPLIAAAATLLVQLETPLDTVREAVTLAHKHSVRVLLNPAPAQTLDDALLAMVDVLTPNESEAALLTGIQTDDQTGVEAAAAALHQRGVATVVITLGSRGAFVSSAEGSFAVRPFAVKAVDSTAAGDVFSGALAVALAEGQVLAKALRFASAAAALSVQRAGAQPSVPRREEVEAMLSESL